MISMLWLGLSLAGLGLFLVGYRMGWSRGLITGLEMARELINLATASSRKEVEKDAVTEED